MDNRLQRMISETDRNKRSALAANVHDRIARLENNYRAMSDRQQVLLSTMIEAGISTVLFGDEVVLTVDMLTQEDVGSVGVGG